MNLLFLVGFSTDEDADIVGPHKARFNGQNMNISGLIDLYPEVSSFDVHRFVNGWSER